MDKDFFTIDEQLKLLQNRGMQINPVVNSRKILESISYYSLINGYGTPFLFTTNPKKYFKLCSIGELYSLYDFDTKLRTILLTYLLNIESRIKTQVIYAYLNDRDELGNRIHFEEDYKELSSFDCSTVEKENKVKALIGDINNRIEKVSKNQNDSFQHYLKKYNYIPLWVLATRMSFGNLSRFYDCMVQKERMEVSKQYKLADSELRAMLDLLTNVRNSAAHGNRLYCFSSKKILPILNKYSWSHKISKDSRNCSRFVDIIICFKVLLSNKQFKAFKNSFKNELKILANKLNSINISKIYDYLGLPLDWENIFK